MTKLRTLKSIKLEKQAAGYHKIDPKLPKKVLPKYVQKFVDYSNEHPYKVLGAGSAAALTAGAGVASQKADKKEVKDFLKNYAVDTTAGGLSGAGVALLTQPLDTKTIRTQAGSKTVGKHFAGLGGRLTKTVASGAIGYPLFTGAQALIKKEREKHASVATIARMAMAAASKLGNARAGRFLKGMVANPKGKAGWAGTATSTAAFMTAPTAKVSRLDTVINDQSKLKNMNNKMDKPW